jgi:serine/threonine protein kinase
VLDFFYFKEHLFIVCELLRENLYEVYKYNRQSQKELYFTIPRLQKVAKQCLIALKYIHGLNLMHCDLKPENILIKSYSRCLIKVIDFGSSCFTSDQLSSYVQSRSYRAPEVVLGHQYDQRIDMWSLGCILAELWTGKVLFQNDSVPTLLAKHIGVVGVSQKDCDWIRAAPLCDDFFTPAGVLYEKKGNIVEYIYPKRTSLKRRVVCDDTQFLDFLRVLLKVNPAERVTSVEALNHPWFKCDYIE